ncbi:terpenoid cyclases/Protein prenyltransferase [Jaminaea rosea]|uniref:Geranylgeranyl transferase type-2 subunit beta n=1 Tax=Jaminaea rosea TaxID=1569628 RepID=A0A316UU90_9BASI|nr:terpenoid cyclases/Protein prenyltransferase [Jaminaea rosea]PWN28876.1 terpenoid cyclases/Protein prenyltransferase [Jaminaea rosea]
MEGPSNLHIQHILRLSSKTTSLSYHLTTHLRLNGVYWGLAALELMSPGSSLLPAQDLVDFVRSCYDASSGGFGSFPGHDAHVLSTCSAVQVLAIKGRLEDLPDREATVAFILSLFNPVTGLLYGDRSRLEEDNRFLYCAVNALAHLSALDRLDKERAVQGVLSCVNFDGGFGRVQGAESHAAQAFTCLGILSILSSLDRLPYQGQRAAAWLSERQLPGGGLNGRPQKLEDVCYSWWVLSSLSILRKLDWIDGEKLRRFILSAQDPDLGGIADRPGNVSDVYHTFFGCAGLSLLGHEGLQPIDPVYAMPQRVVRELGMERPYQRALIKPSS